MISIVCKHEKRRTNGTTKTGATRYRCKDCGKSWTESTAMFGGMRIGLDRAAQIVSMLCEGMSISGTARLTDTDPHTIIDLVNYVGERCTAYMEEHIRGVHVDEIQIDEQWQFIWCKKATAKRKKYVGGCGDSYTFSAIERSTKLIVAWHFGRRDEKHTNAFVIAISKS